MDNNPHSEFIKWYEPLHERFVRYCSSRAFALMETEDLVQESILQTLQAFYRLEDKQKLLGYMIGVANNLVRQAKRRLKFKGEWDEKVLEKLEGRTLDPAVALDVHYLLKAIQQLPEKQREALILFEVSGFSIQEIGTIQGDSEGAIKTRLSRSRKQLRKQLDDGGKVTAMVSDLCGAFAMGGCFSFQKPAISNYIPWELFPDLSHQISYPKYAHPTNTNIGGPEANAPRGQFREGATVGQPKSSGASQPALVWPF